jgi:PIN like domain
VTFYLDASIQIAVRTALDSVREDVVYAGGPNAPKESTQDRHWLTTVGNEGWVVIKRDKRIRTRPWEREALIAAGARTFCLTGAGNYNRWDTLRLLAARWDRIEQVAEKIPGPYIYAVTWQGVRRLSLAGASEPQK